MIDNYRSVTGLRFQTNKITPDMTTYHTFNEVHSSTPVIVIEAGYMNLDRQILTEEANKIASGIVEGLLCYLLEDSQLTEPTAQ
jgi:N-acetylmuramoyl-L-alanine amidase